MKTKKVENLKEVFYKDLIIHLVILIFLSAIYIFGFKMDYVDSVKIIVVLSLAPLVTMITYKVLKNGDKEEFNKIKIYTFISSFFLWFVSSVYLNYIDRDKTMSWQRLIVHIIFSLIFSTTITSVYVFTRKKWDVEIKK
ncbi:hypothetical protein EDD65_11079 [Keratinibaculum paraultunense]|uniref:Uncharacterized protein n=1 Tax=Keratinibaculum paraultunense TaxID=1278232 RepID=A0A4R3KRK7_9FIRM|nr:hypothetical protein [Keratinibaculum paraultunense]QQY79617.1 hypothetical protein JL105_10575 [Keratinibaculum paraultunense]TCS87644.1 hypothetical protein EDD65_11079 [Keratinibaculum paraultunense]